MGRDEEFGDKRHEPSSNNHVECRLMSGAVILARLWFDVLARSFFSHEAEQSFHKISRCGFLALFELLDHANFESVHVVTVLVFDDESWKSLECWHFTVKVFSHRAVDAVLKSFLTVGETFGS
jgi:hypothetical protein